MNPLAVADVPAGVPDVSQERPLRVAALSKYGARAASTRQRLLQYGPYLAAHGITIDLHPLLDDAYLKALMSDRAPSRLAVARSYAKRLQKLLAGDAYDVLWIQYEMFPYLPLLDGIIGALVRKPIVYDIDDAIFHMYDAHRFGMVRALLGGKLLPLMRRASVCLCGNTYLADYVERAGGRAIIVPTVVDTNVFRPAPAKPSSTLTFGWIGSPSTWTYVEPRLPLLLRTMDRLGARFRVVGAGPRAQGIAGIDALDWDEAREVADIWAMDVGLMPITDSAWARGKCGYKLIQYMACGVPGIGSPVGVNSTIIENGLNGLLAANDVEWVTALETLARDADLRRRMGVAGRAKVMTRYSLATQQPVVLAALRAAAGGPTPAGAR